MKTLFRLILIIAAFLACGKAHAGTCPVSSGGNIASAVSSCSSPGTVQLAAGNYSVTSTITLPCGISLSGPTVPYSQTPNQTAIINGSSSFAGSAFQTTSGCSASQTIQYLQWNGQHANTKTNGGGFLLVNGGTTNLTVTNNYLHGADTVGADNDGCCSDSSGQIFFDGSGTTSNINITWNQIGGTSFGDCSGAFADSGSSEEGGGSKCNGVGINSNINNVNITNNNLTYLEEQIKVYSSGATSCTNTNIRYNHFNQDWRLTIETQCFTGNSVSMNVQYNDRIAKYSNTNLNGDDWSIANGCVNGISSTCITHNDYNVLLETSSCCNTGNEIWGDSAENPATTYATSTTTTYNLYQGYWYNAIVWSPAGNLILNNNTMNVVDAGTNTSCGSTSDFPTGGFWNANHNPESGGIPVYSPTCTGNTFSNNITGTYPSASPTISPVSGTFSSSQTVTIANTGTNRDTNTTDWCTTDGSTPTPGSGTAVPYYNGGSFNVTATTTVKCVGMWGALNQPYAYPSNYGYVPSSVVSATYTGGGTVPAATPTFSPGSETFNGTISVSASSTTPSSTLYCTTNGSTPTTSSPVYTGPFSVSTTQQIQCIATATGYIASAVGSATYTQQAAATPSLSPASESFSGTVSVTISDGTAGATIYYTTNGTTPTIASPIYSVPINVSTTATVQAIAAAPGYANSAVGSATYTALLPNFPSGFASGNFGGGAGQIWLENDAAQSGTSIEINQNNVGHMSNNAFWTGSVNTQAFTTTFTFHWNCSDPQTPGVCGQGIVFEIVCNDCNGNPKWYVNNSDAGFTYSAFSGENFSYSFCDSVNNPYCDPSVSYPGYPSGYPVSAAAIKFDLFNTLTSAAGANLTGYYKSGEVPQSPNPYYDMSGSSINMQSGDEFKVVLTYNGATLTETVTDETTSASYSISYLADIPGATGLGLLKTLGGTGVNNTNLVGFGGGTAVATGLAYIDSWVFTPLQSGAVTPVFSVTPGSYSSSQTVSLSSSSSGAVICYSTIQQPSTNGSAGCSAGTKYTAPITISSSETIYAVAGGTGYADSVPIGVATYYINSQAAAPLLTLPSGTYTLPQTTTVNNTTVNLNAAAASLTSLNYYCTATLDSACTPSTAVTGLLTISSPESICVNAQPSQTFSNSATNCYNYAASGTPTAAIPTFSPAAEAFNGTISVSASSTTAGATLYCTTNGTTPTTSSPVYTGPFSISTTTQVQCIATAAGLSNSPVGSATYTQQTTATPVLAPTSQGFYTSVSVSVSDTTPSAVIYCTTNGTTPTTGSPVYSTPFNVTATTTIQCIAATSGYQNSAIGSGTYTLNSPPITSCYQGNAGSVNTVGLGSTVQQIVYCYYASINQTTTCSPTADAYGNQVTNWGATAGTGSISIAPIGSASPGLITGTALGTATSTASVGSTSCNAWNWTVVEPTLTGVTISLVGNGTTVTAGSTIQACANMTYTNPVQHTQVCGSGSDTYGTTPTGWSSSSTANATISASGLVTGVAAGSSNLTVSAGSFNAPNLAITVNAPSSGANVQTNGGQYSGSVTVQ